MFSSGGCVKRFQTSNWQWKTMYLLTMIPRGKSGSKNSLHIQLRTAGKSSSQTQLCSWAKLIFKLVLLISCLVFPKALRVCKGSAISTTGPSTAFTSWWVGHKALNICSVLASIWWYTVLCVCVVEGDHPAYEAEQASLQWASETHPTAGL